MSFFLCGKTRGPRFSASRRRLHVEQLEARCLPSGYTPAQITQAYGFNQFFFTSPSGQQIQGNGAGQTIAIVDAYGSPTIYGDVSTFDQTYGLGSSTSFLTVAQPQGVPKTNAGWALETSLDVEWAHAIAPAANILLVEAKTSSTANLMSAVQYAASQPGVVAVSTSWGSAEYSGETAYDSTFTTPSGHVGGSNGLGGAALPGGITFVASSGDSGVPSYPATSPNVLSVGGTTLNLAAGGGYGSETAWSGSGGGYSTYEPRPSYQSSVQSSTMLSSPDVAYNANPSTGYSVYDTTRYGGQSGWFTVGGTSAGAPQWAALVAIADQGRALAGLGSLNGATQTLPALFSMPSTNFHDITSGRNAGYSAGPGYDLVTGLGSPYANLVIQSLVSYKGTASSPATGTASPTGTGSGPSHAVALPNSAVAAPPEHQPAGGQPSLIIAAPSMSPRGIASPLNPSGLIPSSSAPSGGDEPGQLVAAATLPMGPLTSLQGWSATPAPPPLHGGAALFADRSDGMVTQPGTVLDDLGDAAALPTAFQILVNDSRLEDGDSLEGSPGIPGVGETAMQWPDGNAPAIAVPAEEWPAAAGADSLALAVGLVLASQYGTGEHSPRPHPNGRAGRARLYRYSDDQ